MAAPKNDLTRRRVLQTGAAATLLVAAPPVHAAGDDVGAGIKIGLIGCGGRGGGAVLDALGAAHKSIYPHSGYHTEDAAEGARATRKGVEVVALADLFRDRIDRCAKNLAAVGQPVAEENQFLGFDAYKKLLAIPEINYVILATPPHFRPATFRAAIEAGKNVFMEKPAAVDAPGVRSILETGRLAAEKGLAVGAGTQRRHESTYRDTIGRLHDGAVGEITHAKCYWNGSEVWTITREPGWSDMEWQLRNWNYLTWLGGDHIVEQHIHNLDIINWTLGAVPIRAVSGVGGRQVRTREVHGNVYDHFAVEYEYPEGVSLFSQCRQINSCRSMVGEEVYGTEGWSNCKNDIRPHDGERWRRRERSRAGHELEHEHLIDSIRSGRPINEAPSLAESTMTAILGREAAYSGQQVTWADAMKSETRLGPAEYALGDHPVPPVPMPGTYRFT